MPIFGFCLGCCFDYQLSRSRHNLRLTPRPPNLGTAGFAELRLGTLSPFIDHNAMKRAIAVSLKRLARSYLCENQLLVQRLEALNVFRPNSHPSAGSGANLLQNVPRVTCTLSRSPWLRSRRGWYAGATLRAASLGIPAVAFDRHPVAQGLMIRAPRQAILGFPRRQHSNFKSWTGMAGDVKIPFPQNCWSSII